MLGVVRGVEDFEEDGSWGWGGAGVDGVGGGGVGGGDVGY